MLSSTSVGCLYLLVEISCEILYNATLARNAELRRSYRQIVIDKALGASKRSVRIGGIGPLNMNELVFSPHHAHILFSEASWRMITVRTRGLIREQDQHPRRSLLITDEA